MASKTIKDDLYGKITFNREYWKMKDDVILTVNNKQQNIKCEIEVFSIIYERLILGMVDEEEKIFFNENPDVVHADEAQHIKNVQKNLYKRCFVENAEQTAKNIEEAALKKCEECIENETEESFAKYVGKEKAHRLFNAKTREEKLESLVLKRMRIMKDTIEITCTCDWYKPSGGFAIFEDGSVEMLFVDCMSI